MCFTCNDSTKADNEDVTCHSGSGLYDDDALNTQMSNVRDL